MKKIVGIVILSLLSPASFAAVCNLSTQPLNFGSYDVFNNQSLDATGQVTISCTGNSKTVYTVTVQLNGGMFGNIPNRTMYSGSGNDKVSYNLYIDANRSTVWGDGTGASVTQSVSVNGGSSSVLTIYGRVPGLQDITVGAYTDNVTVLINF
jgi:spore coat protein U-like protein